MTDSNRPYLSIVATARNDNHGGDLRGRLQRFIDGIGDQIQRLGVDCELVLVDWNPPPGKPGLVEIIDWSCWEGMAHRARTIVVPEHVHRQFEHGDRLPLFQMIAKNVGIRRCRGEFVLATNVDILFSDELMKMIAQRALRHGRMYRLDRCDIEPAPPRELSVEQRLDWAPSHMIRRNGKYASVDLRTGQRFPVLWSPTWRVRLLERLQDWNLVPIVTRPVAHLNGCGDFTLMHRDHWFELRGYWERAMYSMHLDSVLCTAAVVHGLKEVVLTDPMRMYHIEHGTGSGFKPEAVDALNARLNAQSISQLSMAEFQQIAIHMRRGDRPTTFNDDNWGLAHESFEEVAPRYGLSTANHSIARVA